MVDRISKLAKERGINISTIEKNIGLSNGIIGKWRKQSPSCDKLKLVADYLNVSIDYLLTGEEYSETTTISSSTVGAVGKHSKGTVTIMKNEEEQSNTQQKQGISDITKEIIRISESLPMREQIKLMNLIYDFEEQYHKSSIK